MALKCYGPSSSTASENEWSFIKYIINRVSYLVIVLVIFVYFFQILNVSYWKTGRGVIYWDTLSYYAYLPATFIYHDLSLKFIDSDVKYYSDKYGRKGFQTGITP